MRKHDSKEEKSGTEVGCCVNGSQMRNSTTSCVICMYMSLCVTVHCYLCCFKFCDIKFI